MKRIYILFILSIGIVTYLSAQTHYNPIPSLLTQLSAAQSDTARSRVFYALTKAYENHNPDTSVLLLNQALTTARSQQNSLNMRQLSCSFGNLYLYIIKDEVKAIEYLNQSIELSKKTNDNLMLSYAYAYLGIIALHQKVGNEIELLTKALDYANNTNDWRSKSLCCSVLSTFSLQRKKIEEAAVYTQQEMAVVKGNDMDRWLTTGLDYAEILEKLGKNEAAKAVYMELNALKHTLPMALGPFIHYNNMGCVEMALQNYAAAERDFLKAWDFEKQKSKADTFHLLFIFRNLVKLYALQGDTKKELDITRRLSEVQLWLQQKRQTNDSRLEMTRTKAAFDLEKKDTEIALINARNNAQQRLTLLFLVLTLSAMIIVFVIRRSRQKIQKQKEELAALNSTKDKLFAIISHDLMSPIATLKNYMLLVDFGAMNQQEFTESTNDLKRDINNLHLMLENTLHWTITQMRKIKPNLEKVDIAEVISEQVGLLQPIANNKSIIISQNVPSGLVLELDKNHLALIIRNLLQNALKFTNTNGIIHFNAQKLTHSDKSTEGEYLIEIKDNGVGMSADVLDKLFKTHENTNRKGTHQEAGTGLGLILTKELVELNKGQISVRSEVGKGTTFGLRF
ncbi:MAG: HAMP domain-containing histidine kinase [Saprospiraceae bacterium]|nr:HAMP domain-containing histidine kinase [Saprospiraceae bacterium]